MLKKKKAAKAELVATLKKIETVWKQEEDVRKKQAEAKAQTYKMNAVQSLLNEQLRSVKESLGVQRTFVDNLKKNVISYERAVMMAEGKFTGGGYKKLRDDLRNLKKSEEYYWHDKNQYEATLALWEKHGEINPYKKVDIEPD